MDGDYLRIHISYIFIQFDEVPEVHNIEEIPNSSSALPSHTTQPTNSELLHVMKEMLEILKSIKETRKDPTDDQSYTVRSTVYIHYLCIKSLINMITSKIYLLASEQSE